MKAPVLRLLCWLLIGVRVPGAENDGLSEAARAQLQRDKVLIGEREFRQSFEPYINNMLPVFITSDALLNAFHVIFEESFARMEAANVARLEALLERLVKALPQAVAELKGAEQWKAKASQRAEIMAKTALSLLGRPAAGSDKTVEGVITAQVKEIEAATGTQKPEWLGPPDNGFQALDFTRYAPRGFYDRSPRMQRYFRAVSWLQSVPFRVKKDEEFLAALLLGRALGHALGEEVRWRGIERVFLDTWAELLPGRDDLDLRELMAAAWSWHSFDLSDDGAWAARREGVLELQFQKSGPLINDQVRLPPLITDRAGEPQYRILPAAALPDAVMFQKTSHLPKIREQRYPHTLEVAAALGSSLAGEQLRKELPAKVWNEVEPGIRWMAQRERSTSLYDEYLGCLRELVDVSDPSAPAFMRGEAWRRKSCQTVLASWAQMRHTLLLQAKLNVVFGAGTNAPPGFVEPEPEFFRRLGELSLRCLALFSEGGVSDDDSEFIVLDELESARAAAAAVHQSGGEYSADGGFALMRAQMRLEGVETLPESPPYPNRLPDTSDAAWEKQMEEYRTKVAPWAGAFRDAMDQLIARLAKADAAKRAELLARMKRQGSLNLKLRWLGLAKICSQAQSIAHFQLRGITLTAEQKEFIRGFGIKLAQAMFYDGNSYIRPRDDAPRVADVFSGPQGHLHAGIGRPRILYVLYPHAGKEVLCVGSVLPYYEFQHGPERLTDEAWRARLQENPPPPPAWVQPDLGPGK
jgi:hypothetical protein